MFSLAGMLSRLNTYNLTSYYNRIKTGFQTAVSYVSPQELHIFWRLSRGMLLCLILALCIIGLFLPAHVPVPIAQGQLTLLSTEQDFTAMAIPARPFDEVRGVQSQGSLLLSKKSIAQSQHPTSSLFSNKQNREFSIITGIELVCFNSHIAKSWFTYICQLLDLPPPQSSF